jgi:chorismate synthase
MNDWGHILKVSLFGESHGPEIGAVIGGLPPGITIDEAAIAADMTRRAPGNSPQSSARKEADRVRIVSGLKNGFTTGAPLCGIIANTDTRPTDYGGEDAPLRPGHADWTALLKYGGFAERSGGGHFSGRLTAPLVFAGAIAKQALAQAYGTKIEGRITAIGGKSDAAAFNETIAAARAEGDSVGGVIEITASAVPPGLGEPFFGSVESRLSELLFSIPAVKGVEFGGGFAMAAMRGSEANDPLALDLEGQPFSKTNHAGGLLGGISNGMPLVLRVAVKPTPSIALEQETVQRDITGNFSECRLKIQGRHDPCIVPRAVVVCEACTALALLDLAFEAARFKF